MCDAFSSLDNAGMLCSNEGGLLVAVPTALSVAFEQHCRSKCICKKRKQEFQHHQGIEPSYVSAGEYCDA